MVAVTVADCPESRTTGDSVRLPADRAWLTVKAVVDDEIVTGVAELSVSFAQ
jgi:hypothetical protein